MAQMTRTIFACAAAFGLSIGAVSPAFATDDRAPLTSPYPSAGKREGRAQTRDGLPSDRQLRDSEKAPDGPVIFF